jgi:hypothetical protein
MRARSLSRSAEASIQEAGWSEATMATPAIANRTLYLRTSGHLYAIGRSSAG